MTTNKSKRWWEERFDKQYTSMAYGEKWRPGMELTPSMIKSFISQVEDRAYKKGIEDTENRYKEELRKKMSNMGKASMSKLTKEQRIEKATKASSARKSVKK